MTFRSFVFDMPKENTKETREIFSRSLLLKKHALAKHLQNKFVASIVFHRRQLPNSLMSTFNLTTCIDRSIATLEEMDFRIWRELSLLPFCNAYEREVLDNTQ